MDAHTTQNEAQITDTLDHGQETNASELVSSDLAAELLPEALIFASIHGLLVGDRTAKSKGTLTGLEMVHVPMCLLPTFYSKEKFDQAVELVPPFSELIDRVSQDAEFIQQSLSRTRRADPFTARLLDIHAKILEEGVIQEFCLGLVRSDYMHDSLTNEILQVELNTTSTAMAGLGTQLFKLHRFLIEGIEQRCHLQAKRIAENNSTEGFAEALALAWKEFGNKSAVILMVVREEEQNLYDQHLLTFKLRESYGLRVIRKSLGEIALEAKIIDNSTLYIGKQPVAVVYYRAGYTPADYPSEAEWEARLLMERSTAIKCPTIAYHLVGAKRMQAELAKPGVLERFIQDNETVKKIRRCFAGLWSLEGPESAAIINEAIARPEAFVLKPQREGGGNNLYDEELKKKLLELKNKDGGEGLAAYILMQRIIPFVHESYVIRAGTLSSHETVSEVGVFGAYLRRGDRVILNKPAGYLDRTKIAASNEVGVLSGFGFMDCPYLV